MLRFICIPYAKNNAFISMDTAAIELHDRENAFCLAVNHLPYVPVLGWTKFNICFWATLRTEIKAFLSLFKLSLNITFYYSL